MCGIGPINHGHLMGCARVRLSADDSPRAVGRGGLRPSRRPGLRPAFLIEWTLALAAFWTTRVSALNRTYFVALVGVYILVGGVIGVVIQPSMEALIEDAQLLASIQDVDIWELLNILLGFGVLGVALGRLGEQVGLWGGESRFDII